MTTADRKRPTVGIAMIARNGADTMEAALTPFVDLVDEIVVVLGGISRDDTEALARRYTDNVHVYRGPLDEEGRLLNFAAARQQSFDALTTDWALVVDTDDVWHRAERLNDVLAFAHDQDAAVVVVPYRIGGMELTQPRLYRRDAGRWRGPVHEYFELADGHQGVKTDWLWLKQEQGEAQRLERIAQNIAIAHDYLAADGRDLNVLAHLVRDMAVAERYQEALVVADRYLARHRAQGARRYEELFSVLYHQAGVCLVLGRLDQALDRALAALKARPYAQAWAVLAEILHESAAGASALNELAAFCADRALAAGKARAGFAIAHRPTAGAACHVKADALLALGRRTEALAAMDLGLSLDANDEALAHKRQILCRELGILP